MKLRLDGTVLLAALLVSTPAFGLTIAGEQDGIASPLPEKGATERTDDRRDYAGMSWDGKDAALNERFIAVVDDPAQWQDLWKRAFDKPAPVVDFENFAVACVFLGSKADWLYHIAFDKPAVKDSVMHITYRLLMLELEYRMAPELGYGRPSFGGQYRMEVYAKQKGVTMQIDRAKGEGDDDLLLLPPLPGS